MGNINSTLLTNWLTWTITQSKHKGLENLIPFGAHFGLCNIVNSALRHGKQQVMSSQTSEPERSRRASLKRGNVISPDPARYVTAIFLSCTTSSSYLEGFRVWRMSMSKLLVRQQMNSLLPRCYVQCIFSCSDQSVVQNVIGFLQDYVPQVSSWREAGRHSSPDSPSPFLGAL